MSDIRAVLVRGNPTADAWSDRVVAALDSRGISYGVDNREEATFGEASKGIGFIHGEIFYPVGRLEGDEEMSEILDNLGYDASHRTNSAA